MQYHPPEFTCETCGWPIEDGDRTFTCTSCEASTCAHCEFLGAIVATCDACNLLPVTARLESIAGELRVALADADALSDEPNLSSPAWQQHFTTLLDASDLFAAALTAYRTAITDDAKVVAP